MTNEERPSGMTGQGSLLDELEMPSVPTGSARRAERSFWPPVLVRYRRPILIVLALVLIGGSVTAYLQLRPRPTPDYLNDPLDDVLDYTLLSGEFNNLSLEERLLLLRDLIDRLKTMSSGDSAAMAMFATRIESDLRAQLEASVKNLGVDLMDAYAEEYSTVPPENQEGYIRDAALNFTRLMEEVSGESSGLPEDDDERIRVMKEQAERDRRVLEEFKPNRLDTGYVVPIVAFLRKDAQEMASTSERARMTRFGVDMTRFLRGQDIQTGEQVEARPTLERDGGG